MIEYLCHLSGNSGIEHTQVHAVMIFKQFIFAPNGDNYGLFILSFSKLPFLQKASSAKPWRQHLHLGALHESIEVECSQISPEALFQTKKAKPFQLQPPRHRHPQKLEPCPAKNSKLWKKRISRLAIL
jgi:hypothetical protein